MPPIAKRKAQKVVSSDIQDVPGLIEEAIDGIEEIAALIDAFYDDGEGGSQKELMSGIATMQERLEKIDEQRESVKLKGKPIQVPVELLAHLDRQEKSNPEYFTQHKVNMATEEQVRLGRYCADFRTLRNDLYERVLKKK